VAPDVLSELTGRLGVRYRDSYGMSEVSTVLGRWVEPGEQPSYRKDPFVMTSLALRGSDGQFVDGPGSGELLVRSPMLASGYLHRPEATTESMSSGWFATGDLFDRDESGGMWFLERAVYMIRSGGENIYPAELETVIRTAPGVAEAVVVAMPDERFGFVPKAYVVAGEGLSIDLDDLSDFVAERVARFKRPRSWELIAAEEVPRSPLGKVLRKELARRAMEQRS
jgi:acyl-CoA synthetase (AMP-forming)/AMP-acid ligase II